MSSLLRVVAGVLMLFGAFGFGLVGYLSWHALLEADAVRRGGRYLEIVAVSLLALHTVGVGGLILVVLRLANVLASPARRDDHVPSPPSNSPRVA